MPPPTKRRRSEPRTFQPRAGSFTIAIVVNTLAYLVARAESTTCGGDLTDSYGVVLSPEYPRPYPADESCLWHIAPNFTHTNGTNNGLTLTFTKFQTQPDNGTVSGDVETLYVYTSDPNNDTSAQPYRRYRGKIAPDPLTIPSSDEIWLKFQSSSTQTPPGSEGTLGFRIIYLANGADVQCNADPLPNGRISNGSGSFVIGSSVEFQCDWGFRMEGARESDCRLEDAGAENVQPKWTQLPNCVSTCTTPAPVSCMETSSSHHSGPSTEKVTRTESGGDDSASEIAIGVTVPIILIVAIAVVVYWCYRRKYPVRMIFGRDFGKFTNPDYRPSTRIHTLVRDDTETQPMELSFTTEPLDSKFSPNPELPPGALQLTSSATNEPAASRVIQLKSSPPQPTRLQGLAALKMHPNLRSRSSDSDSDSDGAELTAEDIEAALGEGSEASSDEEPGPTSPPMNAGKVKLQVDPKEILALGEDTDDDEIDV